MKLADLRPTRPDSDIPISTGILSFRLETSLLDYTCVFHGTCRTLTSNDSFGCRLSLNDVVRWPTESDDCKYPSPHTMS